MLWKWEKCVAARGVTNHFFSIAYSFPSHTPVTISTTLPPCVNVVPVTVMDHNGRLSRSYNWTGGTSSFTQNCVDTSVHLTLSVCAGRLSHRKPFRQDIWPHRKLSCMGRSGSRLPEGAVFLCDKAPVIACMLRDTIKWTACVWRPFEICRCSMKHAPCKVEEQL